MREEIITAILAKVTDGAQVYTYLLTDQEYHDPAMASQIVDGVAFKAILEDVNFDITEEISFQPQGGSSGASIGQIPIDNTSGLFDSWATYNFAGLAWTVKRGYKSQAFADFVTIFAGQGKGRPEFSGQTIYVTLRDNFGYMREPVAKEVFDASTPNESLINTTAPMVFGEAYQVKSALINPPVLFYFSATNLAQTYSVAEGGNSATPQWDATADGHQLFASPSLPITADIAGPPAEIPDEIDDALGGQGQFSDWDSSGNLDYPDLTVQTTDDATLTEGADSVTGVLSIDAGGELDTGYVAGSVIRQFFAASNQPGTAFDSSAGGEVVAADITAAGGSYGTVALNSNSRYSKSLFLEWPEGIAIPEGAQITGLEIIARMRTSGGTVAVSAVGPQTGNGIKYKKFDAPDFDNAAYMDFVYGGQGDMWGGGETLTAESISAEGFRIFILLYFQEATGSTVVDIDQFNVKIYYTTDERYVRLTWENVMEVGERYTVRINSVDESGNLRADWESSVDAQDPQSGKSIIVDGASQLSSSFTAGQADFDLSFFRGTNGDQEISSITLSKGSSTLNRYHGLMRYPHTLAGKDPDVVCDNDALALVQAQADNPRLGHYVVDQTTGEQLSTFLSHSLSAVSWGGIDGLWKAAQLRIPAQPAGDFLEVTQVISEPNTIPDYGEDLRDRAHAARNFYPVPESETAGITANWTRNQIEQIMADWRITERADFNDLIDYDDGGETLSISSIDPATGGEAGGTAVTIYGSGFAAGATVTIGGGAATSVAVVDSATITAVTPAGTAGSVDVVVTVDGDSVTLTDGFEYVAGASTYADAVIASGAFAFYRFEEATGPDILDSAGANDEIWSGSGYTLQEPSLNNAGFSVLLGGAAYFLPGDIFAAGARTYEGYFEMAGSGEQRLFDIQDSFGYFLLRTNNAATGDLQAIVSTSGGSTIIDTTVSAGPHHFAWVKTDTDLKLYIDGALVESKAAVGYSGGGPSRAIGRRRDQNNRFWAGSLDEFALYNGELSAADVLDHYNKGL